MNIGIDARLLERRMTGIGRFLETFLKVLPTIDNENKYFLFSYEELTINNYFKVIKTVKNFLPQKVFSPIWINMILPRFLKKYKIDIFFSINQLIPLIKIKNIKYILVLHDVIYKVDKTFHPFIYRKYLQFFTYFSVKNSDLIITVSEFSKKDILKYYKLNERKIKIIYEAADREFKILNLSEKQKKDLRKKFNFPQQVVLYVGMVENRKNITAILKIADEIYTKRQDIKFVIIGKKGYGAEKLFNEIKKRKNIIYLENIDDKELKEIYNISSVFLFPSFYEGFGFPPLEAMQSGLPVVASNTTSLKEIINSGGLLNDPNDIKSFSKDILKLIENKNFYNEVRSKGIERAKNFNINKTVKETVDLFNSLK